MRASAGAHVVGDGHLDPRLNLEIGEALGAARAGESLPRATAAASA